MFKKVIVVIVNWNRKDYVKKLLCSLKNINYKIEKLIVVDNASTDGSVEMLEEEFKEVFLIKNSENLGGTGGFNTGLRKALDFESDYIWLLDNDVEVEENSLKGLVDIASIDENTAVVGSTICYPDYRDYICEAGGYFNWKRGIIRPNKKNCLFDGENLRDFYDVDYCSACSLLVKTGFIPSAGLMDENFFLTGDDLEWTYRFKKKGHRVLASTKSRIYHQTKVVVSANYIYYNCRNTFYFYSRSSPNKMWAREGILYNFFIYSLLLEEAIEYGFNDLITIYTEAFKDVLSGKMGKCDLKNMSFEKKNIEYKKEIIEGLSGKSIINCVDVEDEVVERVFKLLYKDENVKFLIRNDKRRLEGYEEHFFKYDYKKLLNLIGLIFFRKFDWAICFEEQRGNTIASLLAGRVIILNKNGTVRTKELSKFRFFIIMLKAFFRAIRLYLQFKF